ncbi:alpha/beta fold hydrolase [Actinacidiphila guanduensis]|uniref:Lysophospholipase, alpha-beta hydrolase superfamily n=1 Tax=Actinacidiphila guanduensis TaxID=310781 RepID=A0A1H0LJE2_9ACTN|nr:hypothetical protein [Actinacidiphila guanduensis]SDO68284.1 Lysophospholipase, alpha-beta hydrolase superfamily [Actinacidiphila guanduensis]
MTSASTAPAAATWDAPPQFDPRGTVLLLPGRGEDPRLYERFGARIAADAYRVTVLPDPSRHAEETARQLKEALAGPDGKGPARPVVLAGSDAGALFAVALVATGEVEVDALLLAGLPTRQPDGTAAPAADKTAQAAAGAVPAADGQGAQSAADGRTSVASASGTAQPAGTGAATNASSPGDAARADTAASTGSEAPDPGWSEELGARTACPTHQGRLADTARLARGALYTPLPQEWFERADLAAVTVPVLGLHGAADPVSPPAEARAAYARAPRAELVTLADGRHDSFNDISHRTAAATVVLFLERLRAGADLAPIAVREELHP